jgi:hypothetical protein
MALPPVPPTEQGKTYSGRVIGARVIEIDEENKVLGIQLSIRTPHIYRGRVIPHVLALTHQDTGELENTVEQLTAAGIKGSQVSSGQLTHALEGRTLRFKYDPDAKQASKGVVITECAYVRAGHI